MRFGILPLRKWPLIAVCLLAFGTLLPQAQAGRYLVTVLDAKIAPKKSTGLRWDTGFGKMPLPDTYVTVDVGGQRLSTTIQKNNLNPYWKISKSFELDGTEKAYIQVRDKDGFSDDIVGKTTIAFQSLLSNEPLAFGSVQSLRIKVVRIDAKPAAPARPAVPARPAPPAKPAQPATPPAQPAQPATPPAPPAKPAQPATPPAPPAKPAQPAQPATPPAPPAKPAQPATPPAPPAKPAQPAIPPAPPAKPAQPATPPAQPTQPTPPAPPAPTPPRAVPTPTAPAPAGAFTTAQFCTTLMGHSLRCLQERYKQMASSQDKRQAQMANFLRLIIARLKKQIASPDKTLMLSRCKASLARDNIKPTKACMDCLIASGCVSKAQWKQKCAQTCNAKPTALAPPAKPAAPAQPATPPAPPAKPAQPTTPPTQPAQPNAPAVPPAPPAKPAAPVQPTPPAPPAKPAQPAIPPAPPAQPAQPATPPVPSAKPVQPLAPPTPPAKPAQPAQPNAPAAVDGVMTPQRFCNLVTSKSMVCLQQKLGELGKDPSKASQAGFLKMILKKFKTDQGKHVAKCVAQFDKHQKKRQAENKPPLKSEDLANCWSCLDKNGCSRDGRAKCKALCTKAR